MGTGEGEIIGSSLEQMSRLSSMINLDNTIKGLIVFFVFCRIIIIIRVVKDSSARTNNRLLQIISILLVTLFTPIIGLPLYFIIRPINYKKDNTPWREACITNVIYCHNCKTLNNKEFDCCIGCGENLKIKCKECSKTYSIEYSYCNYCGAPNIEI